MSKLISLLKQLVSEPDGRLSSRRTVRLTWGIGTFLIWSIASLYAVFFTTGVIMAIPESILFLIIGTEGVTAVQRYMERPKEAPKPETKPT